MNKERLKYGAFGALILALAMVAVYAMHFGWHHWLGGHSGGKHGQHYDERHDGRHGGQGYHHGKYLFSERVMKKLSKRLDLSDQQRESLRGIAAEFHPLVQRLREQMRETRKALRELNPQTDNYRTQIADLAKRQAELATVLTVAIGDAKAKFADTLNEEQMAKFMQRF